MLAVQVELLTGRYVATQFNRRNRVEWPPHPARLFSAAVAAWADADEPDPDERAALVWWEQQGPPSIVCSFGDGEVSERSPVIHYVPVNDASAVGRDTSTIYRRLREALDSLDQARAAADEPAAARLQREVAKQRTKAAADSSRATSAGPVPPGVLDVLPERRERQARLYPTAIPADERVTYLWADADEGSGHIDVLGALLHRVARLGHSSSFVAAELVDGAGEPVLVPDDRGWLAIRVAAPGQVDALEAEFAAHRGTEPRTLPAEIATYSEAAPAGDVVRRSVLSNRDWILLSMDTSRRFSLLDTLGLTRAIRKALIRWADPQPPPEIITGHGTAKPGAQTAPSERPHLAIAALPFVAHAHADGRLQAIALILPSEVPDDERESVLVALGRWLDDGGELRLGARGRVTVDRLDILDAPVSAQPRRWSRPARRWLTATPIALDRNPGPLTHRDPRRRQAADREARAVIGRACRYIGLPEPADVVVRGDPPVKGTCPVHRFPRYAVRDGRLQRLLVHAEITFDQPVSGPLVVGAGRYLGYGLCVPADERRGPALGLPGSSSSGSTEVVTRA